jgi:hypothetical protein
LFDLDFVSHCFHKLQTGRFPQQIPLDMHKQNIFLLLQAVFHNLKALNWFYFFLSSRVLPACTMFTLCGSTIAVQDQRMVHDVELQQFTHLGLDIMKAGIAKFDDPMAFGTNEMVVLPETIAFFILRHVFPELVFGHQIAIDKDVQGIVYRRPTDTVVLVLHADIERFHIKMPLSAIDFFQDGKAFRRFPQFFVFEVSRQNTFDFGIYVGIQRHSENKCTNYLHYFIVV